MSHSRNTGSQQTSAPNATGGGDIPSVESSLRRTAKRISQRTTDLIAIAIVGIGVLTVSGRLSEWWTTDAGSVASPAVSSSQLAGSSLLWGSGETAVNLLTGSHPVRMERRVLVGTQDRVDQILRNRLVEIAASTEQLQSETGSEENQPVIREFLEQEQQLLALLKKLVPVENEPDAWRLYRLDRTDNPIPGTFLIATRLSDDPVVKESLAAWAIAMPSGQDQWTSFVLTPTSGHHRTATSTLIAPSRAKLILSLKSDSNDELAVFRQTGAAPADVPRWTEELNDQLLGAGWHNTRPWQQSVSGSTARFERTRSARTPVDQALEVAVSFDSSGTMTGTINVMSIPGIELTPPADSKNFQNSRRQQGP